MMRRMNGLRTGTVGVCVTLSIAACGGGSRSVSSPASNTGRGVRGGTLSLLMNSDFPHLDPARNYLNTSLDFSRLLYRTLTTYEALPGSAGTRVVGDLATDTGTALAGGKTWKFTLKSDIKYEDGTPITAQDVKYGVERSFDPDLPEGNQYLQQFLADVPAGYQGPRKSAGQELSSILVAGKTITFRLKKAVGDFSYTVAEPNVSPVPQGKDSGIQYDNRPFSSGPYKIKTYVRGKTLTLVRNTYWDRKTDPVRGAFPDRIQCTFGLDPATIDQRLIADTAQDQRAVGFDTSLLPESIPQALANPTTQRRTVSGYTNGSRYLALNLRKLPNAKVREAIEYAVNKETYRTARGGKYAGDYLTSNIVPTTPGYKKFNLYPAPPQGDPAKARRLLERARGAGALRLTLATSNTSKGIAAAVAIQAGLKRAGITVNIQQLSGDVFYDVVSDISKEPELALVGWGPDWPSASTVLPPLFDGRQIKPQGNVNWSQFDDPEISDEMDRISAITDLRAQAAAWGDLDEQIMKQAPVVPLLAEKSVDLHGSKVHGAYVHGAFGLFDLVSLSVDP
jgi:peptide/nickel transport system substrate-binding protein